MKVLAGKQKHVVRNSLLALLIGGALGCQSTISAPTGPESEPLPTESVEVVVEAENFEGSSEHIRISENGAAIVAPADTAGWISFQVDIPEAGRYRSELLLKNPGSEPADLWLEDYIDNPDGRTYNITGAIRIPAAVDTFELKGRDGSPLNAGLHPMKLHIGKGSAEVDQIRFTLLKKHRHTPDTLTQQMNGTEWSVVWADEFEGTGPVDTSKWTYDLGDWGWGNNELQYYTVNRPENARRENGVLIIEAHKNDGGNAWTSARLTTREKATFRYGRIEFRAKVPLERGNWAAGWTLGDNYVDERSWPYCGEIDILESVGFELDDATGNGKAHASVHCGAYYFKLGNQPTSELPLADMHDSFHIYAMEWDPSGIKTYVDDQLYFEYGDTSSTLAWPFDEPQNIILNLAMGGGWGGAQGMDETVEHQQFIVDYVRVYAKQ